MIIPNYPELNTITWTLSFYDKNGALVVPTKFRYRLSVLEDGRVVIADTLVNSGLGTTYNLAISFDKHTIVQAEAEYETFVLTVKSFLADGDNSHDEIRYRITRIQFPVTGT